MLVVRYMRHNLNKTNHAPGVVEKAVTPKLAVEKVTAFYDHPPGVVVKSRDATVGAR